MKRDEMAAATAPRCRWVMLCGLSLAGFAAIAQPVASTDEVPRPDDKELRMERARREAVSPYRWIIESGAAKPVAQNRSVTPEPSPQPARPVPVAPRTARAVPILKSVVPTSSPQAQAPVPSAVSVPAHHQDAVPTPPAVDAVVVVTAELAAPRPVPEVDAASTGGVEALPPASLQGGIPPAAHELAAPPAQGFDNPKALADATPAGRTALSTKPLLTLLESPPPDLSKVYCETRGCRGVVVVNVNVDKSGRVAKATLAIKSGNKLLNDRILATVTNWRYLPIAEPASDVVTLRLEDK